MCEPITRLQSFDSMFQLGVIDMNHLRQLQNEEVQERILKGMYKELLEDYTATYATAVTFISHTESSVQEEYFCKKNSLSLTRK